MLDILLVYPKPSQTSPEQAPALSIFYPGAYLEQKGFNVEYIDLRFDSEGYMWSEISREPLCIGISTMTGTQLIEAIRIAKHIKKWIPEQKIVFGGIHPSLLPIQTIIEDYVDYVVAGEGEISLFDLLENIRHGDDNPLIKGVYSKSISGGIREFMKPEEYPFPLTQKTHRFYEIAARNNYVRHLESRGCKYNCGHCFNSIFNRKQYREVPIEKWRDEVSILKRELGLQYLSIGDNVGSYNRLEELCRVLNGFRLKSYFSLRCDFVTDEILSTLDSGCIEHIFFGAESGSNRILKDILKKYRSKEVILQCAELMNKTKNIRTTYSFMCGLPTETYDEFMESVDLARMIYKIDKKAGITFFVFTPYPGCELYNLAIQEGFEPPNRLEEWERVSRTNSSNSIYSNMYLLSGLAFMGRKGHKTNQNFRSINRLKILPFELLAKERIRRNYFKHFELEKRWVNRIISKQVENNARLSATV